MQTASVTTQFNFMKALLHLGFLLTLVAGCSGRPSAIKPPRVDAEAAADAAIEQNDGNGDGKLSKEELAAAPGLASVAGQYDQSADGALDANEIAQGLETWQQSTLGARSVPFTISYNGRPLGGATVRLVPESFLADAIKGASATTSPSGAGMFEMAPEDRPPNAPNIPLMQPGLYKVEVTHPSIKIHAKYNTQTTLGVEISSANPGPEGIRWSLTTK